MTSADYFGGYGGYGGSSAIDGTIDAYQQYLGSLQSQQAGSGLSDLLTGTAGYQQQQLQAQIDNARAGYANALKIKQLEVDAQRYGYDQQRQTALDQLKENQRQYDLQHALDMQKLGLDYGKTLTDYLSTPDRYFQAANFLNFAGRALGRTTAYSMGAGPQVGTPTPQTAQDFAVLAGSTQPTTDASGTVTAGRSTAGSSTVGAGSVMGGTTDTTAGLYAAAAGQGAGADTRAKAIKAMIDAVPPSGVEGITGNDAAVLQAVKAMYSTNLTPQAYTSLTNNPDYLGIMKSGGARLGYNPDQWLATQRASLPGQGSVRGL